MKDDKNNKVSKNVANDIAIVVLGVCCIGLGFGFGKMVFNRDAENIDNMLTASYIRQKLLEANTNNTTEMLWHFSDGTNKKYILQFVEDAIK